MTDTNTANKILEFPKNRIVRETTTVAFEEVMKEKQFRSTQKFADAVTEELISLVLTELDNYEFDLETTEFTKDYVLFQDALRAAIYRQVGVEHYLHSFTDNNINLVAMTPEQSKASKEKFEKKLKKVLEDIDGEE